MAGSYAAAYRQQWRSVAEKVYQDSQTAAAGADEQLRQATARLDAFVNEHLKPAARQKAAATPPVPVVHPARVDNPDWVALNRQLGDLLQQRVKLLLDRTPIHPEVQQTELRIAEIQRRLAETQRWIPARQSGGESSLPLAAAQPAAQTAVPAEDPFVTRVALEKLKEVLAAARGASQQAERQQRQARLACQEEPRIELQFAVPQVALPPSMALRLRLALAALAAGLTATVGLGMVATGAAIEPAVRTVAQLRDPHRPRPRRRPGNRLDQGRPIRPAQPLAAPLDRRRGDRGCQLPGGRGAQRKMTAMYETFFNLNQRPFACVPRVARYYPAAGIEAARSTLSRCLEGAEGVGLVVDRRARARRCCANSWPSNSAASFRSSCSAADGWARAAPCSRRSSTNWDSPIAAWTRANCGWRCQAPHAEQKCPHGAVLLVDEAHALPLRLLDEVLALTNLAQEGQPRVRLVAAGNRILEERFASPKLESFNQRVVARCCLEALNRSETQDYIHAQIAAAGGNGPRAVPEEACQAVYKATDGVPRLINQLCDHALLLAYAAGQRQVGRGASRGGLGRFAAVAHPVE